MKKAPRILLLMDSQPLSLLIVDKLRQGEFDPTYVQATGKVDLAKKLQQQDWDFVIADPQLNQFCYREVLTFFSKHKIDIPLIFVGHSIEENLLLEMVREGATAYVPNSNLLQLIPIINRELRHAQTLRQHLLSSKELQNSNNFLSNVFNMVQEGISIADNNLTIIRTNVWIKNLFSDKMPIVGKKCYEVYHNLSSPCPECPGQMTLEDGLSHQKCMSVISNISGMKWLEFSSYPFRNTGGEVIGFIESLKDVTERKKAEDNLITLNAELEKRVQTRTAQLEAANKELESFSYSVSHDLRSPLSRIEGYSELLLGEYVNVIGEDGKHYLERIIFSVTQMSQLIDDLLKLASITRSEMNFSDINLSCMAKQIADNLLESEPERKAEIIIHSNLHANGDGRLIRLAMDNLLNNAWKYTSKKTLTKIEVGVKNGEDNPTFFIKDNGAGFCMSDIEKLFAPFSRLHSRNEFPGTGVGLATVKRIINRHGGDIWAEGETNKGATFYFTLASNGKAEKKTTCSN